MLSFLAASGAATLAFPGAAAVAAAAEPGLDELIAPPAPGGLTADMVAERAVQTSPGLRADDEERVAQELGVAQANARIIPPVDEFRGSWEVGVRLSWSPTDLIGHEAGRQATLARARQLEAQRAELSDGVALEVKSALTSRNFLGSALPHGARHQERPPLGCRWRAGAGRSRNQKCA